jgi:hypothetical protein
MGSELRTRCDDVAAVSLVRQDANLVAPRDERLDERALRRPIARRVQRHDEAPSLA